MKVSGFLRAVWFVLLVSLAVGQNTSSADAPGAPAAPGKLEGLYTGAWVTTKIKKLDGATNCEVQQLAKGRWVGRFWGEWQKVPFDYTVEFAEIKPEPGAAGQARVRNAAQKFVAGKAVIDGADYDWTGTLSAKAFIIQFTGSRYEGSLELARVR